jgi:hypothetical protein
LNTPELAPIMTMEPTSSAYPARNGIPILNVPKMIAKRLPLQRLNINHKASATTFFDFVDDRRPPRPSTRPPVERNFPRPNLKLFASRTSFSLE